MKPPRQEPSNPESDPEIVAAKKICQEMRKIAKTLPKPEKTKEWEFVTHYLNNFYLLFFDIKNKMEKNPEFKTSRFDNAEKLYGEKWKRFVDENASLIAQIIDVLKQQEIMDELMKRYIELLKNPNTRSLGDQISEEINLRGVVSASWEKLNSLLEKAGEIMKRYGMDPIEFSS